MDGVISDTLPHLQTGDWVAQGTQTALLISEAPAKITARIQEEHDAIIHAICDLIDINFTEA